jgi:hypothetical protein
LWLAPTDQPQVCLVDERGRLQRLSRLLLGQSGGDRSQLVVDEREQVGRGPPVTRRGGFVKASHVGHEGRVYRPAASGSSENGWSAGLPVTDR